MARAHGFSLIETLIVLAIGAILALMASAVVIQVPERSVRLQAQAALTSAVSEALTTRLETGQFPTQVAEPMTLDTCGAQCLSLRYWPEQPHRCGYWELTTSGLRSAGEKGCWP